MQQGGPVHAKPRSLTCADFEYVFTIPYICQHFAAPPTTACPFQLFSFPFTPTGTALQIPQSFCFVACALYTIVIRFILANCLLLNLLCCALESRPSCSSMQSTTCFDVTASCRTHTLWIHHLCSYASCSALRPWKNHPAQLLVHAIAYHCSSLHCYLQTNTHFQVLSVWLYTVKTVVVSGHGHQ